MFHRPASAWPHTTANPETTLLHNPVGIDLFDDEEPNHAAIYLRFADGSRYPARTLNMADREHARTVLAAWLGHGTLNDYRAAVAVAA